MKKLIAFTIWFFIIHNSYFILHTSNKLFAQEISLSISPPLLEVMIKPGASYTQPYEITNNAESDIYLKVNVVPFEPADEEGNVNITSSLQLPAHNQTDNFFSLSNSKLNQTFKLSAGEVKRVLLKVNVPSDESEKDYYFTLLAEQSSEGLFLENQSGGENLIKIGANILLTVSKDLKPKGEIILAKFKAFPKIADIFDGVYFEILGQNIGKAFTKAEGSIEVSYFGRRKVKVLELRTDNILADSARKIKCTASQDERMTRNSQGKTDYCYFSSFVPGYYKARVILNTEEREDIQTAVVSFWLVPAKLIIATLAMVTIIVGIKRKIKKKIY